MFQSKEVGEKLPIVRLGLTMLVINRRDIGKLCYPQPNPKKHNAVLRPAKDLSILYLLISLGEVNGPGPFGRGGER